MRISSYNGNNKFKLDLRNLPDGLYLLELNNNKKLKTVRFELFKIK